MTEKNQATPVNPKKKKGKRKWIWIILLAIAVAIGYFVITAGSRIQDMYQVETAQARDITTYYSFSGHLSPVTNEVQTAKDSLKIKELYVREGDKVTMGQALLRATDGTRVYADEEGTIDELFVKTDDTLQPGSQIARIVDYDTLEVSVDVDEYDIHALTLGKEGTVYLNALDTSVIGTVAEISRDATTSGGVSYYAVKMEIDATEGIRSGMSVEVNILNQEALGAVSISPKALSYDEYNKPFVLMRNAEAQIQIQYVTLGVSDGLYTQITEGIAEGESVYYMESNAMRFFMMGQGGGNSNFRSALTN